jgi:hypothetical protein
MDEVDLLRAAVGASVPPRDEEARSRARARLEDQIAQEIQSIPRGSTKVHRRRVLAAASIAFVVIVALAVQAILPPDRGGPSAAQATLSELASVAQGVTILTLPEGQFFYVKTTGVISRTATDISLGVSWTVLVRVEREKWLSSEGSGRILERFGQPRFASPQDRQAWLEAGSPPLLPQWPRDDLRFGSGELAPRNLGSLPTDPATLANLIASGGSIGSATPESADPLGTVADLLGEVPAAPELRSAVFRANALIPGIDTRIDARGPLGREGTAVTLTRAGVRTELLFDPESSALLAKIVARLDADGQPTQVLERSSYIDRDLVDSSHSRP